MSATYQQYLGRFSLGDDAKDFSLDDGGGADAVALTTGSYYIAGYSGEGTNQLCEHMQAQIRTLGAPYGSATVTYSGSTGKVTIDFATGGTDIDITWTDSALQALLGFTGTQTGAESYTATYSPRYVWRPSLPLSEYPTALASWWGKRSTTRYYEANDGTTTSVEGDLTYGGRYGYRLLPDTDILANSQSHYESLEQFWEDVIHAAQPIRCYPDRTANTSSDVFTGQWRVPDEVGEFTSYISRPRNNYNGLWHFNFELGKYV